MRMKGGCDVADGRKDGDEVMMTSGYDDGDVDKEEVNLKFLLFYAK